jgi:hypothetical protein
MNEWTVHNWWGFNYNRSAYKLYVKIMKYCNQCSSLRD